MQSQLPLFPEQASNFAPNVDALMLFITAMCLFFAVAITAAVIYFFFKYHRKSAERDRRSDSRRHAAGNGVDRGSRWFWRCSCLPGARLFTWITGMRRRTRWTST